MPDKSEESIDRIIGENVRQLRGQRPQEDVAQFMRGRGHKWSQQTVWKVERGERPLRASEVLLLAEYFDVPYNWLIENQETTERIETIREAHRRYTAHLNQLRESLYNTVAGHREIMMILHEISKNGADPLSPLPEDMPERQVRDLRSKLGQLEEFNARGIGHLLDKAWKDVAPQLRAAGLEHETYFWEKGES